MIRLILSILLLLTALLILFPAPEYHLWLLAVIAGEYCWVLALVALIIFASGRRADENFITGSIISAIAFLIFILPIFQAVRISGKLTGELDKELPEKTNSETVVPFAVKKLFDKTPEVDHFRRTYAKYADTSLTLDFYPSKIQGSRPCVIVIHGGSWSSGDSQQLPELNSVLATNGYNVASINYRMAPKRKSPAPIEDVENALKYLRAHAAELSIDTSAFVLLGRSAGAQIALVAGYTLKNEHIAGVIDFYGPADMVWGYSVPSSRLIMDSRKVMENYLGGTYNSAPKQYVNSSPLSFVDSSVPPTLIIHGANDALVAYEHSRRLTEKLQQADVPHYWLRLPWATHGFDYNINGPGGQLSTYAVLRFMNALVRK
ncbi:alpha/beta hydrolase [Mucilaginibacter sp.]|uniref:alpha/beta hydrolase n=1 Tax=Mucilaginibacter sp. TaxID=1882438 RepID=UPI000CAFB2D1|nr:alpha/beta hydrolase [Mucilaginibacter sp.]PLW89627.1 MAG: alpha/beta hydrolase [Mucilaginibacter sp.]HEK19770.1 alpha/beta hydrolase [Bacteroidota bacterium]